jgi:signal transduction histidine kinase
MEDDRPFSLQDLTLAQAFALAGGLVIVLAGLLVGLFVSDRIEKSVVSNAGNTTALYMQSFVAPLVQDLDALHTLPPETLTALQKLLTETPLGQRVVSFKVWQTGGLVIGASNPAIVGQRFEVGEDLRVAWGGDVHASFDDINQDENKAEAALGVPLLEIYSPVRSRRTGQVLCVVEFYEIGTQLRSDLNRDLLESWLAVVAVVLVLGALLFLIVLRGSRTIDAQLAALTDLANRNVALRRRVQDGAVRFTGLTDQVMKRVGADLHDGPAQQIGFVALRLDALRAQVAGNARAEADIDSIDRAVREAIAEIRTISRGLSLPDIERKPLGELVQGLVDAHAARTGSDVRLTMRLASDPPTVVKTCVCRTVQEGLNNAWRHAAGVDQSVTLTLTGRDLRLVISDGGSAQGATPRDRATGDALTGLGLGGLQARAESLGGTVTFGPRADGPGSDLILDLTLDEDDPT